METEQKNDTIEEQETAQGATASEATTPASETTASEATTAASEATQETKAINNGLDVFISYSTKNKNVADA
ncbi:MAG: hypothetical protein IKO41_03880, partial [Lachnospiraceae bacterium]|nr:hypothetical protein [Lachnospiraceae bacterium]